MYNQNGNIVDIKKNDKKYTFVIPAGFVPTSTYKEQIKESFTKAEESLPSKNRNTINIIICQNINYRQSNIDVGDVLFGQEYQCYYGEGNHYWGRNNDGIIHNKNNKVNYYCIYATHNNGISECNKWIFVLDENSVIDIPRMLGIEANNQIKKDDYIEGT